MHVGKNGIKFLRATANVWFQHGIEIDTLINTAKSHAADVVRKQCFYLCFIVNLNCFIVNCSPHLLEDGKWNRWSNFNSCSATCGGGMKTRTNTCTWSGGGRSCTCPRGATCNCGKNSFYGIDKGMICKATHSVACNTNTCPGKNFMYLFFSE